ncbi:MAG: alpha/beta hydrolase [Planctomycetia bacterium]|nr:alpha/beta hydrolase [Planctomycetia bacterium]
MSARKQLYFGAALVCAALGCTTKDEVHTTVIAEPASLPAIGRVSVPSEQLPTNADGLAAPPSEVQVAATGEPSDKTKSASEPARRKGLASILPASASSTSPKLTSPKSAQSDGPSLDERLLFFPVKYPEGNWQPTGLRVDDAWFPSADGTRLHGWYCPVDKPAAVILYCHGNGGNLSYDAPVLRFFQKYLQATTLAFDYRGYGRSEGRATAEGVVADARAARAWLAHQAGVPESQIVLIGRSLGGAVAVQLTGDVRPRGLVLESTFSSLKAVAEHHYPKLASIVPADKFDSAALLANYDGPLLQSHGDRDRTIPFSSGEDLFLAAKGSKEFFRVANGDHNDPQPSDYYGRLMRFVAELP